MTVAHANSTRHPVVPCAVAWIDDEWASLAHMSWDGVISTSAIHRGAGPEAAYLELIVRVLGDAQRVVILGRNSMRLALERAYVALYRWPDRLVDVEHSDVIGEEELIERLRALAAPVDAEAV
jgi:hypothetical protein